MLIYSNKTYRGNDRFTQGVGYIPKSNDAILCSGAEVAKKSATLDYNFSGFKRYGVPGQSSMLGIIHKNTLFGQLSEPSHSYRPISLIKILSATSTSLTVSTTDILKLVNRTEINGVWTMVVDSGEVIRVWDDSQEKFMDGIDDQNRYISSIDTTTGVITLSGALTTSVEAGLDYLLIGDGLEDLVNIVLCDEKIDLRDDARPKALRRNIPIGLIYKARLNTRYIAQWWRFPESFQNVLKTAVKGLFFDYV